METLKLHDMKVTSSTYQKPYVECIFFKYFLLQFARTTRFHNRTFSVSETLHYHFCPMWLFVDGIIIVATAKQK